MKVIWRRYETIFLLIVFIVTSATIPCQCQGQRRSVTQNQTEAVLKRFRNTSSRTYEQKLKELLDCLSEVTGCSVDKGLLTNEILLRGQMRERGEECTSPGKYELAFDEANYNIFRKEYGELQEELLSTGLTFCNPFKYLYCSPQRRCECRPGSAWKPEVNPDVCSLIAGGDCQGEQYLFDPFNSNRINIFNYIQIRALQCSESKSRECDKFLDYFNHPVCVNDTILEVQQKLADHFKDLPSLNFDDPCNLEHHEALLKPPETKWKDYMLRIKKLEEIMVAKTQFCDLRRLFFCGNSSKKCECMKPSFYDEKTKNCTYNRPVEFCMQLSYFQRLRNTLTGRAGTDLFQGYQSASQRECKTGCVVSPDAKPILQFCAICHSSQPISIGRNCNKTITSFLRRLPEIALATDEPNYGKQLDLLDELSDKATELEKVFRLEKGSLCDLQSELEGARAVRRIKNLEAAGTVPVATKEYYRETIRFMDMVIRNYSANGLCKYPDRIVQDPAPPSNVPVVIVKPRPDLVCGLNANATTNPKCYEPKNHDEYVDVLRKRLIPFETISKDQTCPLDVKTLFNLSSASFGTGSAGYYTFLIVTLETHLVNNTQFCNTKSGLECKHPVEVKPETIGKCGLTNSGDLSANNALHFIHVSFVVILFTYFY